MSFTLGDLPSHSYMWGLDLSMGLSGAGGIGGYLARTETNGSTFYHADGSGNITALMDIPMQWHRGEGIGIHSLGYNDSWDELISQNPDATPTEIRQYLHDLEHGFGFGPGY